MTRCHFTLSLVEIVVQESGNYCNAGNAMAIVKPPATWHTTGVIKKDSLDYYRFFARWLKREEEPGYTRSAVAHLFPIDAPGSDTYTWVCTKVVSFLPSTILPISV